MAPRKKATNKMNKKVLFVNDNENYKDNPRADAYLYVEFFEFNNRKFKYRIDFHNGDYCGFDSNKCVSIMKEDGTWESIVDCRTIGATFGNPYYSSLMNKISTKDKYVAAFDDYVQKVYG